MKRIIQDIFPNAGYPIPRDETQLLHEPLSFRSLVVSDLHAGTSGNRADEFSQFLRHVKPNYLYLNGDILDCWELGIWNFKEFERFFKRDRRSDPRPSNNAPVTTLRKILKRIDNGTSVIYIPGNHDEIMRDYVGKSYENSAIYSDAVLRTAANRHYYVTHGDEFDLVIRNHKLISIFGTHLNEFLTKQSLRIDRLRQNARINYVMERFGLSSHWSLAEAIKHGTDEAVCGEAYETTVMSHLFKLNAKIFAKRNKSKDPESIPYYDGIIGSHTHIQKEISALSPIDKKTGKPIGPRNVTYYNTGHWTGTGTIDSTSAPPYSCTALAENFDGKLNFIRWVPGVGVQTIPTLVPSRNALGVSNTLSPAP